jgi:nucleotide-binding universal stress UspA family protein
MLKPFRLLVAYDGSPCADAMIDDLRNAGIPAGAHVLVVSVAERWLPPTSVYEVATEPVVARNQEQAARTALLGATLIAARHPDWTVEQEGHSGSPARVIVQRAREWNAQLVVAGSLGHNAIERVFIGSVSQKIANEAPCSVRISRGRRQSGGLRLLLAYDARLGADKVASRNWPKGTEIRLVMAVDDDERPLGEPEGLANRGSVEVLLAPVVEMLQEAGLDVSTTIREADPEQLILDEAGRLEAHCIFAGSNDHSLVERLLLGTVSGALLSRAPCAVEVVR